MTIEIKDLERRMAPSPQRSRAGFAKTHSRRAPIDGWLSDDETQVSLEQERSPDERTRAGSSKASDTAKQSSRSKAR